MVKLGDGISQFLWDGAYGPVNGGIGIVVFPPAERHVRENLEIPINSRICGPIWLAVYATLTELWGVL